RLAEPALVEHWWSRTRAGFEKAAYTADDESCGLPTDSEAALRLCHHLEQMMEVDPANVLARAKKGYDCVLAAGDDVFPFGEREHFLGELALLAGIMTRVLASREWAYKWLDRAEAWLVSGPDAPAALARVAYQRLAVKIEEGEFAEVLGLVQAV